MIPTVTLTPTAVKLRDKYTRMLPYLNERSRRVWAGMEAESLGHGGITIVQAATNLDHKTIRRGITELSEGIEGKVDLNRIRKKGGGRKKAAAKDPTLIDDIKNIVEPATLGDPERPLRWTSKSLHHIEAELNQESHRASHSLVGRILTDLEYSLQANRKTREGEKDHPDRNAQFEHISETAKAFQKTDCPVISVDEKKKENIGNFKNNGKEYHKKGKPEQVNVYDFIDKEKGKVNPYGVYDLSKDKGWVSVGISNDTAAFAVNSIRAWWNNLGKSAYPKAKKLMITADCGGSNGYRVRLWKVELQKFANEIGRSITTCHFPPGTSKWNKIEHRLFAFISKNWRGQPLIDRATVVSLIGSTKTKTGLAVRAVLDENDYEKGIKVPDEELAAVNIERDQFHGEWNYTIHPK